MLFHICVVGFQFLCTCTIVHLTFKSPSVHIPWPTSLPAFSRDVDPLTLSICLTCTHCLFHLLSEIKGAGSTSRRGSVAKKDEKEKKVGLLCSATSLSLEWSAWACMLPVLSRPRYSLRLQDCRESRRNVNPIVLFSNCSFTCLPPNTSTYVLLSLYTILICVGFLC